MTDFRHTEQRCTKSDDFNTYSDLVKNRKYYKINILHPLA